MKQLVIKKDDLKHNIEAIQKFAGADEYKIIGVVKGNRLRAPV